MIMFIDLKKRLNRKKSFQSLMKIEINNENTINEKNNRRFNKKSKRKKIYIDVQFNLKNDFIYYKNERRRLCISILCENFFSHDTRRLISCKSLLMLLSYF